jgi:mycothiol synthase
MHIGLIENFLPDPAALEIPGLAFRAFRGEADFPLMLAIINACKKVDGLERADTLESIRAQYANLHNCDPSRDMLFAEVNGETVGYGRCWWDLAGDGSWVGWHLGFVQPAWRGRGLGRVLLGFLEGRLRAQASQQAAPGLFSVEAYESEQARLALLQRAGYLGARYEDLMVRPDLEHIPDALLPPGLEVRPVQPEQIDQIWDAADEAFRDHWGYIPLPPEERRQMRQEPDFDPSLWQVAWDGDQVAGMVLNFVNANENAEYRRQRGWTEGICVRRPWRRRGLARALLAQSLQALKERGLTEAALTVDTQNLSGAHHLYASLGFKPVRRYGFYRKPM